MSDRSASDGAGAAVDAGAAVLADAVAATDASDGVGATASGAGTGPRLPDRPAVPATLWGMVALLACERCLLAAGSGWACALAVAGSVVAAALLARALRRRRALRPCALLVCACLALGAAASAVELASQDATASALGGSSVSSWTLELTGDMSPGELGWRGRARLVHDGRAWSDVWVTCDEPLGIGSRLACVGRFSPNADDEWGASSRAQGLCGTVRVVRVLGCECAEGPYGALLDLRGCVMDSLRPGSSPTRALLAGAVCGSSAHVTSAGLSELFSSCGVSHLVAVSGGHLALLAGMLGGLLGRTGMGPASRSAVMLLVTGAFVGFCGAPVSAVRSWAMTLVAAAAQLAGRRAHPLSSVCAVALVMALLDPGASGQLGFLLSVASVCGICVAGPYLMYLARVLLALPPAPARVPRPLWRAAASLVGASGDALALTLACQVVTMPMSCAAFGTLSLVAPLANLLVGPAFSLLLALGLAAGALFWCPPLQALPLAACDAVASAVLAVLEVVSRVPHAVVPLPLDEAPATVVVLAALAALVACWPRATRRGLVLGAGCVALPLVAAMALPGLLAGPSVCVLDVGQADAILVRDGPRAVLVDAGEADGACARALARHGVWHLDALVVTHLHDDHMGGVGEVGRSVGFDRLLVAEGVDASGLAGDAEVQQLSLGDVVRVGRFSLTAVWPEGPVDGADNEDSLELLLRFEDGARSLVGLLTGDAERDETHDCVADGRVGDLDFLKVGHHGSRVSVREEDLATLRPEVSVASAGEGNRYGHPAPECVEALVGAGSRFLCTMDCGDVTIEPGASGPRVRCSRGPMLQ